MTKEGLKVESARFIPLGMAPLRMGPDQGVYGAGFSEVCKPWAERHNAFGVGGNPVV